MAKRIRYKKHPDKANVLESVQTFVSEKTGAKYKVRINLLETTYELKNLRSNLLIRGGENVNNLNVLKRNVKKHLENLGVNLGVEKRDRTFGLCKKGYTQQKHLEEKDEGFREAVGIES